MGELDGLTVAAVAGEAAKASGAVEPGDGSAGKGTQQSADSGLEALDADVAAAKAADGKAGEAGEAGAGSAPDMQALVDAKVQEAVKALREEYEGPGGHIAKVRSKKDKELAKLKAELEAREQADYEAALKLARRDPDSAVQKLTGIVESERSRRRMQQQEEELAAWADKVLEELGLDPEDEQVAEVAAQVGPLMSEGASYAFLGEMGKLARMKEAEARKAAEKELASALEGLPGMIQAAVAKQLAESGLAAVDGSEQQAPAVENAIKNIKSPSRLLAMGWKDVVKGRR